MHNTYTSLRPTNYSVTSSRTISATVVRDWTLSKMHVERTDEVVEALEGATELCNRVRLYLVIAFKRISYPCLPS